MVATPWAILLCKFSDDASEPYPRQRYEELFTTAGSGKFNMVDFFRDMSHGRCGCQRIKSVRVVYPRQDTCGVYRQRDK